MQDGGPARSFEAVVVVRKAILHDHILGEGHISAIDGYGRIGSLEFRDFLD